MGKRPSDATKSLIEKMRKEWLAEFDRIAPPVIKEVENARGRLRQAMDVLETMTERAEELAGDLDYMIDRAARIREAACHWQAEDWFPEDGRGPSEPDDALNYEVWVGDEVHELLAAVGSLGQLRECANPECGNKFLDSPYSRERKYCGAYCRVRAYRARQKSEEGGAGEDETSTGPKGG